MVPFLVLPVVSDEVVLCVAAGRQLHNKSSVFLRSITKSSITGERVAAASFGGCDYRAGDRLPVGVDHASRDRYTRLNVDRDRVRIRSDIEFEVIEVTPELTSRRLFFPLP